MKWAKGKTNTQKRPATVKVGLVLMDFKCDKADGKQYIFVYSCRYNAKWCLSNSLFEMLQNCWCWKVVSIHPSVFYISLFLFRVTWGFWFIPFFNFFFFIISIGNCNTVFKCLLRSGNIATTMSDNARNRSWSDDYTGCKQANSIAILSKALRWEAKVKVSAPKMLEIIRHHTGKLCMHNYCKSKLNQEIGL